jgi:choline monooxygenase
MTPPDAPEAQPWDPQAPIEIARTPPASWYRNPERDHLERRAIIGRGWQVLAHRDEVAEPGSFVAGCSAGEPWVLVRDESGQLRALSNVCRHNGTQVASGRGRAQRLVCPYHGWAYHLDGRLAKAPRIAGIRDFDRDEFALGRLEVCEIGPLIFVNVDGLAPPLELPELQRRLDATGWQDLVRVERRSYELDCNWKVFIDNYLDGGYHVPSLHPALAAELDLGSYRTEIFERYSIQSVPPAKDASARLSHSALYAWVYPTLMLNRYGPMMDVNVVFPLGPERCSVQFDWYFEPGCDPEFIAASIAASEQVQDEDVAISKSVQVGLGSMHYRPGLYAPQVEQGKHHFHRLVHEDVGRPLGEPG